MSGRTRSQPATTTPRAAAKMLMRRSGTMKNNGHNATSSGNDLMPAPTRHEAQEQVLALAFEGRWSRAEMAQRVTVSARTIKRWLASEPFKLELARRRANLAESLMYVPYADKGSRVVALSQMAESARREYEARPLLEETRTTPTGDITTESFNRDAHEAFRKSLDDIAKELGERAPNTTNVHAGQIIMVAVAPDILEAV